MSARALQRVVVRMLYDPALVEAVYADADAALAGAPLTAAERSWLTQADRRRWKADPMRRYRSLQGLLEEFPVSGALVVCRRGVPALDAFFSSPAFHDCIMARGSLALTFGRWLQREGACAPVARLETAIARVRRAGAPPAEGARWQLAPWVDAFPAPEGLLEAWQARLARLRGHPEGEVAAAIDAASISMPELGDETAGVIVEGPGDPSVGEAPPPLVSLLEALRSPADTERVHALLRQLGADPGEEAELLAGFVDDGLVVPARARGVDPGE